MFQKCADCIINMNTLIILLTNVLSNLGLYHCNLYAEEKQWILTSNKMGSGEIHKLWLNSFYLIP